MRDAARALLIKITPTTKEPSSDGTMPSSMRPTAAAGRPTELARARADSESDSLPPPLAKRVRLLVP